MKPARTASFMIIKLILMKKIFRASAALSLSLMLLSSGCSKLDINVSPNNPNVDKATPESLIPSAVISTAGRLGGDLAIVGGMWAQFWTQNNSSSQYRLVDSYNLQNASLFFSGPYTELYTGALTDYQQAIVKSVELKDWRYNLIATVMKAYTYQVLVDLFDKVPYTEALQPTVFLQPKFDDGFEVYKGLIAEIDAALAQDYLNTPHTQIQSRIDLVFGAKGTATFETQMENWERFANTLKLKMYLRMVNAHPADAEAGIKGLVDGDAEFLDIDAGITGFIDAPNQSNPLYEYNFRRLNTTDNLRASYTLVHWLEVNNDPRAQAYYGVDSPIPTIHQGDYNGTQQHPEYSDAVNPAINATDPVWFFTRAEVSFMLAEVMERYYGGVGAKVLYDRGLEQAFAQKALQPGVLATTKYAYPAGNFETKLEAIIVQKWASLFGSHALEAFFEQNRTGYPRTSAVYSRDAAYVPGQLVYGPNGVTGAGNFPRRFLFPDVERTRNTNTPVEVPISTKVWWGK